MEQPSEQALIVVRQLPIIDEELRRVKAEIEKEVELALSMPCTEETKVEVKRVRAKLSKTLGTYEEQRKTVKKAILAPYDAFEAVYRECITEPLTEADAALQKKIAAVEDEVKMRTRESVEMFFNELIEAADVDLSFLTFARTEIKVGVSDTLKSLKDAARTFVERVAGEVKMIAEHTYADEILVEYKTTLNASNAVVTVGNRHKAIEAEQARRAVTEALQREIAEKARNVAEVAKSSVGADVGPKVVFPTPVEREDESAESNIAFGADAHGEIEVVADPVFTVKLRVTAPKDVLIELRTFLDQLKERGCKYEQYAD